MAGSLLVRRKGLLISVVTGTFAVIRPLKNRALVYLVLSLAAALQEANRMSVVQ